MLVYWAMWARGNQLIRRPMNVLARLIRQKLDDEEIEFHRPDDPSDFSPEIESIDKAVAKLRDEDPRLRRFVMKYYLRGGSHIDVAAAMKIDERLVREIHARALSSVLRHTRIIYDELTREKR